jgi:DNA-binding response OmpR family regulator
MAKILIVDDDKDISELMKIVLEKEKFEVSIINNPKLVIDDSNLKEYNLILLDIMMPEISGTELCAKIRTSVACPIVFVSAKNDVIDKIVGYEVGADDYITKPFDSKELVAKVKAHLRMSDRIREQAITNDSDEIVVGKITINPNKFIAKKDDKIVELTTKEFELLSYLVKNKDIALSKEQIFESVWGSDYGDIGTIAVNIKSLRDKLDKDAKYIITIWGYGYKFVNGENNDQ